MVVIEKKTDFIHNTDAKDEKRGMELMSGGHRLNHGLNDNQEMERMYSDWLEDLESESYVIYNQEYSKWNTKTQNGKKFVDIDFDIEANVNWGKKKIEWVRLPSNAEFVVDGIDAFDITQGKIGDCWFLSSISALAQKRKLIKKVLMPQYNNQPEARAGGIYRFRFYHMGEWMDIIIDDQLPKKYAAKSLGNEYWVPLIEKAYAKFFGGYKNIIGGDPTWALCNLTGGITLELLDFCPKTIQTLADNGFNLFDFIYRIQKEAVFATSNTENFKSNSETHSVGVEGLVAGHAYAMLEVARVHMRDSKEQVRIVKIRNPWAKTEWQGKWHDQDPVWGQIESDEKDLYHTDEDDGAFWMEWEDWLSEFETLDICYMPDEEKGKNHRIIGDFYGGVNAPLDVTELSKSYLNPSTTHQIEIMVGEPQPGKFGQLLDHQEVLFQFLIDCQVREPHFICFNVFTGLPEGKNEYTRKQLKAATRIEPILPIQQGYQIDYYRHNGYIFNLKPGRYVVVISAAPKTQNQKPTEFLLRCIGDDIIVHHLH